MRRDQDTERYKGAFLIITFYLHSHLNLIKKQAVYVATTVLKSLCSPTLFTTFFDIVNNSRNKMQPYIIFQSLRIVD
jgi:hypothetical protein